MGSTLRVAFLVLTAVVWLASAVPHAALRDRLEQDIDRIERDLVRAEKGDDWAAAVKGDDDTFASTGSQKVFPSSSREVCSTDDLTVWLNGDYKPQAGVNSATVQWQDAKGGDIGKPFECPLMQDENQKKWGFAIKSTQYQAGIAKFKVTPKDVDTKVTTFTKDLKIATPSYTLTVPGSRTTGACHSFKLDGRGRCGDNKLENTIQILKHNVGSAAGPVKKTQASDKKTPDNLLSIEIGKDLPAGMYDFRLLDKGKKVVASITGFVAGFVNVDGKDRSLKEVKEWVEDEGHDTAPDLVAVSAAAVKCLGAAPSSVPLGVTSCHNEEDHTAECAKIPIKSACNAHATKKAVVPCVWTGGKCRVQKDKKQTDVTRKLFFSVSGATHGQTYASEVIDPKDKDAGRVHDAKYDKYPTSNTDMDGKSISYKGVRFGGHTTQECSQKPVDGDMVIWKHVRKERNACLKAKKKFQARYFIDRPFCDCCAHYFRSSKVIDEKGFITPKYNSWLTMIVGDIKASRIGETGRKRYGDKAKGEDVVAKNNANRKGWPPMVFNVLGGKN